ncbi:hypothetical protein AB0B67_45030, partial [Streptomyces spectabilis]
MSRERPFFVAGQWSGPEVEVWEVREAPQNADEYTAVLEEWTADAAARDEGAAHLGELVLGAGLVERVAVALEEREV